MTNGNRLNKIEERLEKVEEQVSNHIPTKLDKLIESMERIYINIIDTQKDIIAVKHEQMKITRSLKHYKIYLGP